MARDVEMLRSQVTASALEGDGRFSRLDQGRAQGDPVRQPGHRSARRWRAGRHERKYTWQDKVIQLANDNNTAIYTFDPRGLGPPAVGRAAVDC